ncbi:protein phosphatase 2C 70-like isoform X2 [Phragmites australis]|uniref:protein phosphatase 2C 70-like isoform X2 n=1 Tax=Phragmites australis TaxID=29695 RepID=UPI002D7867E2|nr:protein phosphatase 2C 70-like isoform X2 [Phragmites australis]
MAAPPLALLAAAIAALVILVFVVFAFRRWWRRRRRRALEAAAAVPAPVAVQNENLNRPLLSENRDDHSCQSSSFLESTAGESSKIQTNRSNTTPRSHAITDSGRIYPAESCPTQGETHVIIVENDTSEEFQLGSTLKRTTLSNWATPDKRHKRRGSGEDNRNGSSIFLKDYTYQSNLDLEVIAGPSHGISCSRKSTSSSMLPITLGRVPPNDLVLKDSEVSGKHARINWNARTLKWELVDMGSLNGTFLNSQAIHHPDVGSRHWSEPAELAHGDIITLGTSSKLSISLQNQRVPAGVGMASDPMVARRSGKKLPMEDISFCQCPLQDVEQFGLFGIFDGHGGDGAAKAVSKILPENVANILSHPETKERVLSSSDASDVLRYAFTLTEAAIDHQYEGCTATALLIWFDQNKDYFAQCANLGDSACVMSINGKMIDMTEDHRVASTTERARIARTGKPLKDGEVRLSGLNLARMFGDKFLKEQDSRFSSEPYVSEAIHITKSCTGFAVIASDGLWDVISTKRAVQLVVEGNERNTGDNTSADKVANRVLSEARNLRTKDNTSVIFVDFDILRTDP